MFPPRPRPDPLPAAVRADVLALASGLADPALAGRLRAALAGLGPEAAEPVGGALRRAGLGRRGDVLPVRVVEGDLAWVLIHAADGRLREAALRALQGPPAGAFELAAMLHRLNDWVPQVRAAAEGWLARATVAPGLAAEVLVALWPRTQRFTRWSDAGRAGRAALAARPEVLAALAERLAAARGGTPGEVLRLAMRDPGFDVHLPALAGGAALPMVRAAAVAALLSGRVWWRGGLAKQRGPEGVTWAEAPEGRALTLAPDRLAVAEAAARDRAASVRKLPAGALPELARLDPARAHALAERLAADRNAAVRMRARWWLERAGG